MERETAPPPSTGDDAVDEALRALDELGPIGRDHVTAFDAVHRALADRLAEPSE